MTAVNSAPRYCDLDPLLQIIIELRVMNELIAQSNDMADRIENLRASVYSDFAALPTLTL